MVVKKDVDAEAQAMFEPFRDWVVYGPRSLEELGYKPGLEPIKEEPAPELVGAEDLDSNSYIEAKVKLPEMDIPLPVPRLSAGQGMNAET